MVFCYTILGRSLGISVAPLEFFFIVPAVQLVTMVPVTINGLGLREGAFVILLASLGVPRESAVVLSLLWLAGVLLYGVLGGVIYSTRVREPGY